MSGGVMDYEATKNNEQKTLISCDSSQRNTKGDVWSYAFNESAYIFGQSYHPASEYGAQVI